MTIIFFMKYGNLQNNFKRDLTVLIRDGTPMIPMVIFSLSSIDLLTRCGLHLKSYKDQTSPEWDVHRFRYRHWLLEFSMILSFQRSPHIAFSKDNAVSVIIKHMSNIQMGFSLGYSSRTFISDIYWIPTQPVPCAVKR